MSLELRNRLERAFALQLSATIVWNHPTVRELAAVLAERTGIGLDERHEALAQPDDVFREEEGGSAREALQRELAELAGMMERL
jgi:hypothetical protein